MTKRLLTLVLVCILAIPILVLPASATSGGVTSTQFDMFATALGNLLNDIESNLISWYEAINANMVSWFDAVNQNMIFWFQQVNTGLGNVYSILRTVNTNIIDYCLSIYEECQSIGESIKSWWSEQMATLNTIKNRFQSLFDYTWSQGSTEGWFQKVASYLKSLVQGQTELDPDIDAVGDEISDADKEYQDNMDIVQEATRPDYEGVTVDPNQLVGGLGEVAIYGTMLKQIFEVNGFLYQLGCIPNSV